MDSLATFGAFSPSTIMKLHLALLACAALLGTGTAAPLQDARKGGLTLKNVSALGFGNDGLLLVADSALAAVVAIDTGDTGPFMKLAAPVADLGTLLASGLGTTPDNLNVIDLAVNPASGRIYLAVQRRPDNAGLLLTVDAAGRVLPFDTSKAAWAAVSLPGGTDSKVTRITDVAFDGDRIFATGSANEEFASRIFTIPVPVRHGDSAAVFSAETYHVAHRKWETKAPIQSFIPYHAKDGRYVVGAFACTPVARFRVDDLESGAKVKGVSMVELGSGNRPLDLFAYTDASGKEWLVVHTQRFKDNLFGPSKYWGVRVSMDYINAVEEVNEKAAWRDVKEKAGPEGMEILDALFGAVQVDRLGDREMVVLRDSDGRLNLEVVALP
jgi:hypothetical protein